MTDDLYYRKLENTSTTDLVDMIRDKDKQIAELDMKRKAERKIFQGIVEKKNEQLIKAKEIIERLLATPRSIYGRDEDGELTLFFDSDYEELKKQAEQFLQENK